MGETCSFSESGTTVSKFCDNGCCDNECCSETSVDTKALAIALSVILAFLLLVALIILIIYCWWKRSKRGKNKTDWRHKDMALTDMKSGTDRNRNQLNGHANGHLGQFIKINRLVQTGDPNADPRDSILWGRTNRWSSKPNSISSSPRRAWNRTIRPIDNFSQTTDDDVSYYKQYPLPFLTNRESDVPRFSTPQSDYLNEITVHKEQGVQTAVPKPNHYDPNKATKERNKQFLASWTPTAPWRPSAQLKSISKVNPKPLNATTNVAQKENEPLYPVHRHRQESLFGSEHSGSLSLNQSRSNEFDSNS